MIGLPLNAFATPLLSMAGLLIVGVTLLLAAGCLLVRSTRSPVHRQRIGEMSLFAVLIWCLLACVPLPRLFPELPLTTDHTDKVGQSNGQRHPHSSNARTFSRHPTTAPLYRADQTEQRAADPKTPAVEIAAFMPTQGTEAAFSTVLDMPPDLAGATGRDSQAASPLKLRPDLAASAIAMHSANVAADTALSDRSVSSREILAGLYVTGACLCAAWLALGQAILLRLRRQGCPPEPWLADVYQTLARSHAAPTARLIVTENCGRAMSWGVWRPVILMPHALCRRTNLEQVRTILLHELGHVTQRDAWGNLLICLCLPVLYFHPLFWWLRVQIRLSAELIADDWAARQTGKEAYVEELVALAKVTAGRGMLLPGVTGVLSSPSQFYRRMNMLLTREEPLLTRPSMRWRVALFGSWTAAVIVAASLAGMRPAVGQSSADPAAAPANKTVPAAPAVVTEVPANSPAAVSTAPAASNAPGTVPPALTPGIDPATGVVAEPPKPEPAVNGQIDAEREKLLNERLQIELRLKALDELAPAKGQAGQSANARPGKVTSFRTVDDQGRSVTEVWSVTESGKLDKLISRTATAAQTVILNKSENGTPTGVITETHNVDGKVITQRFVVGVGGEKNGIKWLTVGDGRAPHSAAATATAATVTALPATTTAAPPAVTVQPAKSGEDPRQGGQQLDLVTLATSYADAVGAVDTARSKVSEIEPLVESRTVSTRELSAAKIVLQNAERKERLLHRIAQSAANSLRAQLDELSKLAEVGAVSKSQLRDIDSRLEILNQILATSPETGKKAEPGAPAEPATDSNRRAF